MRRKRAEEPTTKQPWLPQHPFEGQAVIDRAGNTLTYLEGCWHTQRVVDFMRRPALEQSAPPAMAVGEMVSGLAGQLALSPHEYNPPSPPTPPDQNAHRVGCTCEDCWNAV